MRERIQGLLDGGWVAMMVRWLAQGSGLGGGVHSPSRTHSPTAVEIAIEATPSEGEAGSSCIMPGGQIQMTATVGFMRVCASCSCGSNQPKVTY